MEGKTPTEKVHSLASIVTTLSEQVKALDGNIKGQVAEHSRTVHGLGEVKTTVVRIEEQLGELQRWKVELAALANLKTDVALLKRDVEKLEKVKEEWGRRIWAMAGPIIGAVIGWALGHFSR
jgi:ubiquinone biosynthesis protein UbiJ